ncbi:hypothetical protein D3C76_1722160 [compost metagenome]
MANFLTNLVEGLYGVIPIRNITGDVMEFEAIAQLLLQPGFLARGLRTATHYHDKTITRQTTADCCADTPHTARYQCNTFIGHFPIL